MSEQHPTPATVSQPFLTDPNPMIVSAPENDSNVVVWFREPVEMRSESERRTVLSNRHVLAAARLIQDSTRTTFIDANGEVVGEFDTGNVLDIDWGVRHESATSTSGAKPPAEPTASTPPQDESDLEGLTPGTKEWLDIIKDLYPRAYAPWSEHEDEELTAEYEAGMTLRNIALVHQRRLGGIRSRIKRLELER